MNVDVLIFFEHKNRELESNLLLAKRLREKGLSVYLIQDGWNAAPMSSFIKTKVLVTPWCYDDKNYERLQVVKGSLPNDSFIIVNTHCEQITSEDALRFVLPTGKAKETYHFAWGNFFKELLIKEGVPEDSICITGSPRLDFFKPKYARISASKSELSKRYLLDEKKKWILLIGNYSAAFFSDDQISRLEKRSIANAKENRTLSRFSMKRIFSWYGEMANRFKDENIEFIYRPHPSEPVSDLAKNFEENNKNVHVIKEHAIRDWLVNCDAAFTWNSTSSVEAAYAEIPVFALRPCKIPKKLQFSLLENLTQLSNETELINAVSDVLNGKVSAVNKKFEEALEYYYQKNEKDAADISADFIESIISKPKYLTITNRPFLYGLPKTLSFCLKLLLKKTNLLGEIKHFKKINDDYIGRDEYEETLKKIEALS